MYKLPDQILRWIGGSTGGLGEFAGSFEQASKQGLAGGTAAMVGDLSRLSGGASSKLSNIGKSLQKPPETLLTTTLKIQLLMFLHIALALMILIIIQSKAIHLKCLNSHLETLQKDKC